MRIDFLVESMNSSWSKFQESCIQKNEKFGLSENKKIFFYNFCFPSICSLSWDFYKTFKQRENRVSNFKLWVWNCMISGVVNEGNLPISSLLLFKKNFPQLKTITRAKFLKLSIKKKKNIFSVIGSLKNKNNYNKLFQNKISLLNIKHHSLKSNENFFGKKEKDWSEEDSIEDVESTHLEKYEKICPPNFLLAVIEKVYRKNTKWTIVLKDGILNINKKDFLFNSCKCEFFW